MNNLAADCDLWYILTDRLDRLPDITKNLSPQKVVVTESDIYPSLVHGQRPGESLHAMVLATVAGKSAVHVSIPGQSWAPITKNVRDRTNARLHKGSALSDGSYPKPGRGVEVKFPTGLSTCYKNPKNN